ncbi:serpin family protein [Hymenobacter sp. BT664]|uniref:Serpin family protein n=1 Tax=Hymenobacter montanus TaxID=2771359 RepID=A0A927B9X9_9BACT|nr:serpin family protein [Hymenobacter montanus]MBD2766576.1 serpin family protein [Hymenobacter montanus]
MLTSSSKLFLPSLLAGALLFTACQKNGATPDQPPYVHQLSDAERSTVANANDFAFRAFGTLRGAAPADNLCISPLSISAALTMAYNGADGTTKTAMKQALGFQPQTDSEINESFRSLFSWLGSLDPNVTFTTGNSIWYGQQYQLQTPFVQQNQTYFGATVRGVDFRSSATKDVINNWVNTQTGGKIPTIVEATKPDDVMYLINALYFKGTWAYRFDPQSTQPGPFYRENGSPITKNFMSLTRGRYRRYADGQKLIVDLPYGNQHFSMTLVVPQGRSTLADVAGRLTRSQLDTCLAAANVTSLELRLPKFRLEYAQKLNDALAQLGMGVAFTDQANFGRMLAGRTINLQISEVQHKTFLEVNEEGTEAAAATSVGVTVTSIPEVVLVNRPFLFLIREKSSNAILFIGQIMNP